MLALAAVAVAGVLFGSGAGWSGRLPDAPVGLASLGALAVAFQSVIWSYYGYPDVAKIAEEVKDPDRNLPRILLVGILGTTAPLPAAERGVPERAAARAARRLDARARRRDRRPSLGPRAGGAIDALALLVLLAGLNGNLFVTPRVLFGLSRDGLGPASLARVNRGGTPAPAMLLVGVVSAAARGRRGTFERLLSLAIVLVLATDGFMVPVLFRLRARRPAAPFRVPLYPAVPLAFLSVYALLLAGRSGSSPRRRRRARGARGRRASSRARGAAPAPG